MMGWISVDKTISKKRVHWVLMLVMLASIVVGYSQIVFKNAERIKTDISIASDEVKMKFLVSRISDILAVQPSIFEKLKDPMSLVEILAQLGGINSIRLYQSIRRKDGIQRKNILGSDGYIASDLKKSDFDYIFVHPLPQNSNPWAPVCYTRGLLPNGQWAEDGLYGSKYGLIAFANGYVNLFLETVSKDILAYIFSDIGGRADSDGAKPEFIETPLF